MKSSVVLKLDHDVYLEMPLLKGYLANYGAKLVEHSLADALSAINEHTPDIIVTGAAFIGKDIIDAGQCKGLCGIVKAGSGLDNVDVAYARAKGVAVANTPACVAEAVAEYAISLMLSLSRKLSHLHETMRQEGWVRATSVWQGRELHQKTIGLIGFGRIARKVARITHFGFEMPVFAYDPYVGAEEMAEAGVRKTEDLAWLLSQTDIVSIHCALTPSTTNLIGAEQFHTMRPSAFLINVSRGGIIDQEALLAALLEKRIAGVALDVYPKEPLNIGTHPIFSQMANMENVLLSPHLAWYTAEADQRLQETVGQRCIDLIRGVI
uniref:D-3-phosphoglycerate dehydrogenase n=1 Tax=Candidatus Kentrum sp. MB TaxID=2138164 RepID=A0A451BCP1_9GAMM|nr:MAG: D-3-phosphoglycerate dehydrogenase [Candidatus Kentron sp. MB]VFK76052.1 MAG: D-3-phosphoglycerate dehydrogenase [Candidatus Kentron sp. MB]